LLYLEAQHVKESSLKAIKKFQILHALKTIQRWWRIKYQEIKVRSAARIQLMARRYFQRMSRRLAALQQIRANLRQLSLRSALRLYIKKRRLSTAYLRTDFL
jgi:hypothetical protein